MSHTEQALPRRAGQQGLWVLVAVVMSLALLASCGDDDKDPTPNPTPDAGQQEDAGTPDSGTPDSGTPDAGPQVCGPTTVNCAEQTIDTLSLRTVVNTGVVREEGTTSGEFLTFVDSTAGGLNPTMSYTYLRFTATGAEQVQIHDHQALVSQDWDIAVRRYTMRVNSGTSGPSCVSVAKVAEGTPFAQVAAVDSSWTFETEKWWDDSSGTCTLIPDDSGLNGPKTALGAFWEYPVRCVQMTGQVFAVRLADGRHVKLEVMGYYEPAAQQTCNETGAAPTPSGSGSIRIKWAFLP
ncbi:HmuY family protein [Myxococcus fulvus]|uniref:HmuY family protein n=1 Tax=Myxococcus fulvus TaxID=33 RepID=UPI0020C170B6|nr:HmuY family protein [Myxococcus fulvus]MCK8498799.1 HmuY family protein [Myxococcus fulvus]